MKSHTLEDQEMETFMQELLALLQTNQDNIYEVLEAIEDEEGVAQKVQHGGSHALSVSVKCRIAALCRIK
jgi:hypothetical protein